MWQFFAEHWLGFLTAIPALGLVGVLVAVVAFGVPAMLVVERMVSAGIAVVGFFKTPLGQVVGLALLLVVAFLAGDIRRTRIAAAERRAEIAAATAAAAERDATIKRDVAGDAAARILKIKAERDALETRANDYEANLKLSPRPGCRADGDDVRDYDERMRELSKRPLGAARQPAR